MNVGRERVQEVEEEEVEKERKENGWMVVGVDGWESGGEQRRT